MSEMTETNAKARHRLSRRGALLLPLAAGLSGCSFFDDLFTSNKPPLPGTRIAVMTTRRGLEVEANFHPTIALPPPAATPDWPQPGGAPAHEMGHPALGDAISPAWSTTIGEGGGYRRKISAQPVIAAGRVFTMDSDGLVRADAVENGAHVWEFDTQGEDDRSSNVGGGLSVGGTTLYAATGRGELIALEAASGKQLWRKPLGTAARAAGTVADGKVFVPTLDDQMFAFAAADGRKLWTYQATSAAAAVLGLPSPAYADGIVVGGFGGGDLVAVRADTGTVAWTDSLASQSGRNSIADLSTVRGLPVIVNGQVYASSLGGLTVALDLRSGRRLWEREIASYESMCVAGDWIFMLTSDQIAVCLARADGQVAWTSQLPNYEDMEKLKDPVVWHGPVLAGDRLLFAGTNARATSVSPYTGKILGSQPLPDKAALAPVVAGGTVYIVIDDGSMVALR